MSRIIGIARCNCNSCDREMVKLEAWPQFWFHADDGSLSCMDQAAIKVNIGQSTTVRKPQQENATTLPKDSWIPWDPAPIRAASPKLRKWAEGYDALDVLKCRIDSVSDIVQNGMDDNKSSIESLRIKIKSIEENAAKTIQYNEGVKEYNDELDEEWEQFKGHVDDILKRLEPLENRSDMLENVDTRLQTMEEFAESDDREERLAEVESFKESWEGWVDDVEKRLGDQEDWGILSDKVKTLTNIITKLNAEPLKTAAERMLAAKVDDLVKRLDRVDDMNRKRDNRVVSILTRLAKVEESVENQTEDDDQL